MENLVGEPVVWNRNRNDAGVAVSPKLDQEVVILAQQRMRLANADRSLQSLGEWLSRGKRPAEKVRDDRCAIKS